MLSRTRRISNREYVYIPASKKGRHTGRDEVLVQRTNASGNVSKLYTHIKNPFVQMDVGGWEKGKNLYLIYAKNPNRAYSAMLNFGYVPDNDPRSTPDPLFGT